MNYRSQLGLRAMIVLAADDGAAASAVAQATTFRNIKIGGKEIGEHEFQVKVPYSEGHTLNAAEANVLNQTYGENVRNNVAGKIRSEKEKFDKDEANKGKTFSLDTVTITEGEGDAAVTKTLRSMLAEYAGSYEFGMRTIRSAEPVDPVQREARVIAREALSEAFREQGIKRKDVDDDTYEEALNAFAQDAEIQKEAERRVKQREKIGKSGLDIKALLASKETPEGEDEGEDGEDAGDETEGDEPEGSES